jgi:hypothetical protein
VKTGVEIKKRAEKIAGKREGKWSKRELSRWIFGQRGRGSYVSVDCSTRKGEKVKRVKVRIRK